MDGHSLPTARPADWLARALVAGFAAAAVLLGILLLAYALAAVFASLEPSSRPSMQQAGEWFRALNASPLLDLRQTSVYALLGAQLAIGLVGALVYGALQPWWKADVSMSGPLFGVVLSLITLLGLLPLLGGGLLGIGLGAGPLPMVGLLTAYLAYGTVMSAVFGPAGDVLLGPATAEETLALERTTRISAVGLGLGGLAGAAAGLALLQLTASTGQPGAFNAPPTALVLGLGLVGAALGLQAGSLAGLPGSSHVRLAARRTDTIAATTFVDHVPERSMPREAHRPLRHLQVVAAVGECTRGYAVGDVFECGSYGKISPPLCPAAERALRPLVAAMARGDPDAPRSIVCPIYDHMLVLRLNGASPERAGALARR